jgi:hypothetical protein
MHLMLNCPSTCHRMCKEYDLTLDFNLILIYVVTEVKFNFKF